MDDTLYILIADDGTTETTLMSTDLAALKTFAEDHHRAERTRIKPRCMIRDEAGHLVAVMDERTSTWVAPGRFDA